MAQEIGSILILNNNKNEVNNSGTVISPMFKEDIIILIKYYLFNQKLQNDLILSKKDDEKPICYKSNFYLINSNVLDIFKNHYLCYNLIHFLYH